MATTPYDRLRRLEAERLGPEGARRAEFDRQLPNRLGSPSRSAEEQNAMLLDSSRAFVNKPMNALQQFIQSKLTGAVGRSTPQPTASSPQTSMMDRLRGAGSSVMDSLREAGSRRLASEQEPGSLGPNLRVSRGTLPNPFSGTAGGKALSGDVAGAAQALPDALTSLGIHGAGAKAPKPRIVTVDDEAIRHLANSLKKSTPLGYIDYGQLKGILLQHINPKVNMPMSARNATFGELYRGVMKYLDLDADDVPNEGFIKNLAKTYMEIFEGKHKLPPGSQPKMK